MSTNTQNANAENAAVEQPEVRKGLYGVVADYTSVSKVMQIGRASCRERV